MEYLDLILELVPYVLSIFAILLGFKKPKNKVVTTEEIEAKGEAIKQKYIDKQIKKNKLANNKSEEAVEATVNTYEKLNEEDIY